MMRHILRFFKKSHGFPTSPDWLTRRAAHTPNPGLPTYSPLINLLATRLQEFPGDGGIDNIDRVISVVTDQEWAQFKVPTGSDIPDRLTFKVRRCWNAPIEQLVKAGVVPSSEVLAQVLPQITSQVRAAAI